MAEILAPLVAEVVQNAISESYTNMRSMFVSTKNLDETYELLVEHMKKLLAIRQDKEREVQRHKQKDTTSCYQLWTNRVSKIEGEVLVLTDEYQRKRQSYYHIWRSPLKKKMVNKGLEIDDLMIDECLKEFLVDKPPERVLKELDVSQISGYPTLQGALEEILCLFKNNKIKTIGVCGKKGVGKTTIMQNLNNNEEVAKQFDIVIFVRVSANDHELQRKIANRLMLDIEAIKDKNSSDEIARRIYKELESKNYLLILDEVTSVVNLDKLGVPTDKNESKVVIATHRPEVYKLSKAKAKRYITVKELSPNEAWKMFRDVVRAISPAIDFPDIQPIARLVCNRCSRLPLLIHKIASSFKLKESVSSWQAGLEDLRPWPELQNQGLEELYSCLKFCYDELKDEKKQKCFLYTSLYPADSKIYTDYLVECWAAQGLLGDVNDKRPYRSARHRGIDLLEHLTNVSLLEKGERMIYIRMNDCMRQLALHISSKHPECSFCLGGSEQSDEFSSSRAWQQARWVSMIDQKLSNLPANQDCSMLLILLLQKNPKFATIPQTFFENMGSLLLLDLYGTVIGQLPSSLSKLTSLRALFLNSCPLLGSLPSEVRSLQCLEVLDIRDTKVTFIPLDIGFLTNLRCLRIPYIASSEQNRVHVISSLHKLEELVIEVISYEQWHNDADIVLQQVASLEKLTTLRCCFPSSVILNNFLTTSKSWRSCKQDYSFRFFVGCKNSGQPQILEVFEDRITKYLKYCNGEQKDDSVLNEVLPETDAFELLCHKDIKRLSDFAGIASLSRIRGFLIEKCNKLSTILTGDVSGNTMHSIQIQNGAILPNLEQLYLENLLNLKCAFRGPLQIGTLSKIQTLSLKNCPSLVAIFSKGAIQHFSELQKLIVADCSKIEELIILRNGIEIKRDVLPKLEMLVLVNLPNLRVICSNQTLAWSSLEILRIHGCGKLKALPFGTDNAANLRSIIANEEWWSELEWENNNNDVPQRFQLMFVASNGYFP